MLFAHKHFSQIVRQPIIISKKKIWIDFDLKKKIFKNMAMKSEAGIFKPRFFKLGLL